MRIVTRTAAASLLIPFYLVSGQSSGDLRKAADLITPAKVLERIGVIAHDSMRGRNTPSAGLDKTAAYFAGLYQRWGLKPAGENGTWYQHYPMVRRRLDQAKTVLEIAEGPTVSRYPMGQWAYATGRPTTEPVTGSIVLVGGALTPAIIDSAALRGKIVVAIYDAAKAVNWNSWLNAIRRQQPSAMVILRNDPPGTFHAMRTRSANAPWAVEVPYTSPGVPVVFVHDSAFANDPMNSNRPDWNQTRAATGPMITTVGNDVIMTITTADEIVERTTAPNVVAMIEGSDPTLKHEYIVYSAHMDHVGVVGDIGGGCGINPAAPADSICNGADDDASGTVGIAMVAEAFQSLRRKPKRSIIILHVSGEEKGLLGSEWFAAHPTVPLERIVANVNMDMIGRNNPDSIVVIGKEHSDLGTTLARINSAHPELRMTASDDLWPDEQFYFRSDHYNFARKGVPILFFFNGVHPQYHQPTDHVELIDTGKLSRVAKLGFFLGADIANAAVKPQWRAESYKEIVGQ
jgi:hypothetical protein